MKKPCRNCPKNKCSNCPVKEPRATKVKLPEVTLHYSRKLTKTEAVEEAVELLYRLILKRDRVVVKESKIEYP